MFFDVEVNLMRKYCYAPDIKKYVVLLFRASESNRER